MMQRCPEGLSAAVFMHWWMTLFGAKPGVCTDAWTCLKVAVSDPDDPELNGAKPEHLAWALLFPKKCGSEEELATITGARDEKTLCKWSHTFATCVSHLLFDLVRSPQEGS
jgi:hypothetical protein